MFIFKILRPAEWQDLVARGETRGAPVDIADGYVHFSTQEQLSGTLSKHFAGAGDLHLLAFDSAAMGRALTWETARGGALFPHLYAPLRLADMLWQMPLPGGDAGYELPSPLATRSGPKGSSTS